MKMIPAQPGWRVAWAEVLEDAHPISVDFYVMDVIAWRDSGEWVEPVATNGMTISTNIANLDYAIIEPSGQIVHQGPSHFASLDDYKEYVFPHLVERIEVRIARQRADRAKATTQ